MPAKYRLTYFDSRGRGEVIRLIFKVADEEFEDRRMKMEDWSTIKSGKLTAVSPRGSTVSGVVHYWLKVNRHIHKITARLTERAA